MTDTASYTTLTTTTIDNGIALSASCSNDLLTCNDCQILLQDSEAQERHTRCTWHVYNMKRRIASLPPISQEVYTARVLPSDAEIGVELPENSSTELDRDPVHTCLFCQKTFERGDRALDDCCQHMSTSHGFFVPDLELIVDLESLFDYLTTVVHEWHECLYCGKSKSSTTGVHSHMRDMGHCKLNLEREPELLGFWEKREPLRHLPSSSHSIALSAVTSTARITSRPPPIKPRQTGGGTLRLLGDEAQALQDLCRDRSSRHLARRDEMGLQNVGPQQRHTLVVAAKRAQKEENVASRASEWSYAKKANKQKHDQAHGSLSWAKGGLHELLPR